MSNQAILPEEFNAAKVTFTEPKKAKSKDGKSFVIRGYMQYDGQLRYWESPWLRAPFGVNGFDGKEGEKKNYALNISARAVDPADQPKVDHWFEQWKLVDKAFTDHVITHSKTALGKPYKESQREVVLALQTNMVRAGDKTDENGVAYPPRISPKVERDYEQVDRPAISVYLDSNTEPTELANFEELVNLIPKGSKVRLIIKPKPWYISGKCGIACSVVQAQVLTIGSAKLHGFAFSKSAMKPVAGASDDAEEHSSATASTSSSSSKPAAASKPATKGKEPTIAEAAEEVEEVEVEDDQVEVEDDVEAM